MKKTAISFIAISLLLTGTTALGGDPDDEELSEPVAPKSAPASAAGGTNAARTANVLNFEADVIEGEKKGADLLLEIESTKLEPDTVLYQRADFNDFHARDLKRRPRIALPPSPESVRPAPAKPGSAKP
ncbi:MAG TPA: hypothetical protein DCS07_06000 [Bdellovibrionales bacterium]|nr:MAG: hypothetical protein A2Z97_13055 [Bdellovibrionales bacterium GWB1_52_6]OFZ05760.1 MAG: hypothetical protein A2X97_03605 [Bdellovibrionales bacterium GWA1_52_35]OFZ37811.1 MAG: hypothetical protein A2070_03555 [Bdellovibrionales bacterium GWC1_52_8]HAR42170.1 hypothetical protein [Bdellovibrionales bacterium]HCM40299.1 hypothetical protein [Bdellovibrionales bacterium]